MNQRERFLKTVQHEEPDRLLYYVQGFIGNSFNEWIEKIEPDIPDDQVVIDSMFGDRTVRNWIGDDFVEFAVTAPNGYPNVSLEEKPGCSVSPFGSITFNGKTYAGKPYSWYVGPMFDTLEKRSAFYEAHGEPWDEHFYPPDELFVYYHKKLEYLEHQDYPWMPITRGGSIWEYLFEGLGPKQLSYLSRKDPAALHRIVNEITAPVKYCTKRMLEEGALVVGLADDMGQKDRPLVSPKMFEEFVVPAYRELIGLAHKHGAYFWLHSCGNITELLPLLVDCGLDVWQTLEPASGVNLAEVKEKYGDRITFAGAIDYSRTVTFGTPDEIDAHVRKVLKAGMPGGGYIAGPSHDIMDVPLANVIQARDLVKKLGVYPCTL
jgi:hypothetical protein